MKNSKKILIVSSEFPPQPGGIGNHALHLSHYLARDNNKVCVLTDFRSKEGEEELLFDANLSFSVVRIARMKILYLTYLDRIRKYVQLLKTFKPDIIIASGKFPIWLVGLIIKGGKNAQ